MVIGGTVVSDCNDEVLGVRVALARRSTETEDPWLRQRVRMLS